MTNFLPAFHILIVFFTILIGSAIAISDQNGNSQTHPYVIADFYTYVYAPNCTDSLDSSTNYSTTLHGLQRLECLAMCSREPLCARAVHEESGLSCLLEDGVGGCPHGRQMWLERISDDIETGVNQEEEDVPELTSVHQMDYQDYLNEATTEMNQPCTSSPCLNHGHCENDVTNTVYYCHCEQGFHGTHCENDDGPDMSGSELYSSAENYFGGVWGINDTCPTGSFASGFRLREGVNFGDVLGVSMIELTCTNTLTLGIVGNISSDGYQLGEYGSYQACPPNYFIVAFRKTNQPHGNEIISNFDNTGANNVDVTCRGASIDGSDTQDIMGDGPLYAGAWPGSWSEECVPGEAVKAIATRVDPSAGVVDIVMYCGAY